MADQEVGKPIDEFPTYEITNYGRVFNTYSGREMHLSPTVNGDLTVGMMRDRHQHRRSVKVLVARAFVPGETDNFTTPIQLDGDKYNLRADNIVWRPRWFAWEYTRQLSHIPDWIHDRPVQDSQRSYFTIFDAAIINGLLFEDIRRSLLSGRRVFPTGEVYVYLDKKVAV